ncbi:MAG: ABC transporter permease subunit [Candidatus Riflebacteria bacterium]
MRSIIIKDLKQAFSGILFAVAIALALFILHRGDRDVLFGINFGIIGPMFMWIITHASLSDERNRGTLPFLMSLPLERRKIWLSKMLAGMLGGLICYLILYIISVLAGMSFIPKLYRMHDFRIGPVELFVVGPLLAWAMGVFTTVLHPVLSAVTVIGATAAIGMQGFRFDSITRFNWIPYSIFAIIIFITISYRHFKCQPNEGSRRFTVFSLKHFSAAVVVFLLAAASLNQLAEYANRNWNPVNIKDFGYLGSKTRFLIAGRGSSSWFDVITDPDSIDHRIYDLESKKLFEIGCRVFNSLVFDREKKNVAFSTDLGMFGPGKSTLILQSVDSGKKTSVDSYADAVGFTPNGKLVYRRMALKSQPMADVGIDFFFNNSNDYCNTLRVFDPADGSRSLIATFPADTDFWDWWTSPYNAAIATGNGKAWFIDLDNLSVKKLDLGLEKGKSYNFGGMSHLSLPSIRCNVKGDWDNPTYYVFKADGSWIKHAVPNANMLEAAANGNALFRVYSDDAGNRKVLLAKADGTIQKLETTFPTISDACFSKSGRYLSLKAWKSDSNHNTENMLEILDLENPDRKWKIENCYPVHLTATDDESFIYSHGYRAMRINPETNGNPELLIDYENLLGRRDEK